MSGWKERSGITAGLVRGKNKMASKKEKTEIIDMKGKGDLAKIAGKIEAGKDRHNGDAELERSHEELARSYVEEDHDHEHDHDHDHVHAISGHGHKHQHTKQVLNRLARAAGHLDKVRRMVERGDDCTDVLIQLSAVIAALNKTGKVILEDHIESCIVDAVKVGDEKAIDDLKNAIDRFLK